MNCKCNFFFKYDGITRTAVAQRMVLSVSSLVQFHVLNIRPCITSIDKLIFTLEKTTSEPELRFNLKKEHLELMPIVLEALIEQCPIQGLELTID